jgi:hypothetical protein
MYEVEIGPAGVVLLGGGVFTEDELDVEETVDGALLDGNDDSPLLEFIEEGVRLALVSLPVALEAELQKN